MKRPDTTRIIEVLVRGTALIKPDASGISFIFLPKVKKCGRVFSDETEIGIDGKALFMHAYALYALFPLRNIKSDAIHRSVESKELVRMESETG